MTKRIGQLAIAGLVGVAAFSGIAHAGSGNSTMACVSASGRTKLNAFFGDLSGVLESATFTIDKDSITITGDETSSDVRIVNLKYKVFTMFAEKTRSDYAFVELVANPATMRIDDSRDFMSITFTGMVVGTEPRQGFDQRSKDIEVKCIINYNKP